MRAPGWDFNDACGGRTLFQEVSLAVNWIASSRQHGDPSMIVSVSVELRRHSPPPIDTTTSTAASTPTTTTPTYTITADAGAAPATATAYYTYEGLCKYKGFAIISV